MKLKICDNLHIIDGAIISYSTEVGTLTPTSIEANGKYSRTTSKHIGRVARIVGKHVKWVTTSKQLFHQHYLGVRVTYSESLNPASTLKILTKMHETGSSLVDAAVLSLPALKGKEYVKCTDQLLAKGICPQMIEDIHRLNQFGLISA